MTINQFIDNIISNIDIDGEIQLLAKRMIQELEQEMNCGSPGGGTLGHHMQQLSQQQQQSIAQQQMLQAQYNYMVNSHLQQQQGANHGNWPAGAQVHSNSAGTYGSGGGGAGAAYGTGAPCHISWTSNPNSDPTTWTSKPLESAGIKVGEIVGWRIWTIRGSYLGAYSAGHIWAPGENMEGNVPDYGYEGIWSFKKKSDAIKKLLENPSPHAFGSIKMWGDVIEHTIGYRAQFAKIISLDDVHPSDKKLLQTLRENYGLCQPLSSIPRRLACQMPTEAHSTASQKLLNLLQLKPMKS